MSSSAQPDPATTIDVDSQIRQIWQWLSRVHDPEVPVLSVLDLGVVRSVEIAHNGARVTSEFSEAFLPENDVEYVLEAMPVSAVFSPENNDTTHSAPIVAAPFPGEITISITPTYTGCPAMNMIAANIRLELLSKGLAHVTVKEVLTPAWTTDWMSAAGRKKLLAYGIAPPQAKARVDKLLFHDTPVPCPHCGATHTERIAEFGSTACKSLHRCLECREPFDSFKCH
jgi:ring-1,2-phenylacetyl-CoA epoxidase subunit PaaD